MSSKRKQTANMKSYRTICKSCERCGKSKASKKEFNVHHIEAIADGGEDEHYNMSFLCKPCHNEWHMQEHIGQVFEDWLDTVPSWFQYHYNNFSEEERATVNLNQAWVGYVTTQQLLAFGFNVKIDNNSIAAKQTYGTPKIEYVNV
jgi:hypothetical protein